MNCELLLWVASCLHHCADRHSGDSMGGHGDNAYVTSETTAWIMNCFRELQLACVIVLIDALGAT